jgi:hypothetical protein
MCTQTQNTWIPDKQATPDGRDDAARETLLLTRNVFLVIVAKQHDFCPPSFVFCPLEVKTIDKSRGFAIIAVSTTLKKEE